MQTPLTKKDANLDDFANPCRYARHPQILVKAPKEARNSQIVCSAVQMGKIKRI